MMILHMQSRLRYSFGVLALAGAYLFLGRWGLNLYPIDQFAAPVWIPTGLSLAVLLLAGVEYWPGIAIGAFWVNFWQGASVPLASIFTLGNTLEAVLGWHLLKKSGFNVSLSRLRDAVSLFVLGGLLSTLASAGIGAGALYLAGHIPASELAAAFRVWWVGDLLSDLLITPFLLILATSRISHHSWRRWAEAGLVTASLLFMSHLVFAHTLASTYGNLLRPYMIFPPLLWAALWFGPPGAVAATSLSAFVALWETLHGRGPFSYELVTNNLLGLQLFIGIASLTSLIFAAMAAERAHSRRLTHDSEQRFRSLIENSFEGIVLLNADGKFSYLAPTRQRILGYPETALLGRWIFDLLHPDDRPLAAQRFSDVLQNPFKIVKLQARLRHQDGSWRWLEGIGSNCLTHSAIRGVVVNFHDITEGKLAEEALKESHQSLKNEVQESTGNLVSAIKLLHDSEERFRLLVEGVEDYAIYGLDPAGYVVTWNSGAERAKGYRADEIIGQHFSRFYPPEDVQAGRPMMLLQRAVEEGRVRDEGWHVRKDGSQFFAEVILTALRDKSGVLKGFSKITRDITERRRLDHQLRRSREQLTEAQRIAHIGSWEWDNQQKALTWSDELYRIHGLPPQGFRVLYADVIRAVHPDDRRKFKNALRETARTLELTPFEYRIFRGKEERILRALGRVVVDASGQPLRLVGTAQDVTEQKRAEQTLQQKEEQLFQAQKLEAIGRLAGGVAHDFNNLITGILGISQDLKGTFGTNDPRREDVEEIIKASNRAFEVTRQLLAFGRRQILTRHAIEINGTIRDFAKLLHRLIGEDIRLDLRLCEDSWVKMDPGNMGQILMNLALNARDAMPRGGAISLSTSRIQHPKGGGMVPHLLLEVRDTGKGMDPETLKHIFEPFFTTKTKEKGTGLGLATVYGIIKQSDGDVTVESQLGRGTTFRIYLQLEAGKPATEVASPKPALPTQGHETVLVVEDEEIVRRVVVKRLTSAGYAVLEANDGKMALRLFEAHGSTIDLVITDVVMPEMNGREVVNQIRGRRPDVRVLYMSGYPEEIIAHRGTLEAGINFLEKSAIQKELLKKVREVLEKPGAASLKPSVY